MRRHIPENSPKEYALYAALAVLTLIPFGIDLVVPLGTAIWVAYLAPLALSFLAWRPQVPVLLAASSTILIVIGYFNAPSGIDPEVAQANRVLGAATACIIAAIGVFFIRNKRAVKTEEWLHLGQVGLSQAIAGEQQVNELGENILRFLSGHLHAAAGALFIRDGDGYRRAGMQGVPLDAPVPERFAIGDGLLGQAAKEAAVLSLEAVPDDYLYLGSSLGRAKPAALLIMPAGADGEVNAVAELGFLGGDLKPARVFLERAAEPIATAIRSAKYRERLQELLEETQRQAEELQQQSEELRTSNEELEEQSRALQESQTRLELQQAELEQTNAQLEEQTQMLERQRDDLTRAQGALEKQAGALEQASRYKSEFVANMSHELRTPLNSLLILAKLLAGNRDGNLTEEQIRFAQTIESAGNDLLALINDILDISKMEAGRIELQVGPARVGEIVDRLSEVFAPAASQKGLRLQTEIAPGTPSALVTDSQRLEQVLRNFIANAIKFTERGAVTLRIAPAGAGRIAFAVQDTGIGIAEDQQETIFEAFRQADGTINRQYGGTGLGLSISRELARLLGGSIAVDSAAGAGSTFTLTLPLEHSGAAAPEERPVRGAEPARQAGRRASRTTASG